MWGEESREPVSCREPISDFSFEVSRMSGFLAKLSPGCDKQHVPMVDGCVGHFGPGVEEVHPLDEVAHPDAQGLAGLVGVLLLGCSLCMQSPLSIAESCS